LCGDPIEPRRNIFALAYTFFDRWRLAYNPAATFKIISTVAKLYFRYSAMNAGKSTSMLQVA